MTRKDMYIEALEYGKNNLLNGVTHESLKSHLESLGYKFNDKASLNNYHDIFNAIFGVSVKDDDGKDRNYMDMDAYFNYIEHQELLEARQSAKRATYLALGAILISLVTSCISIWVSYQPVFLSSDQIRVVEKAADHGETVKILEAIHSELKSNNRPKKERREKSAAP